MSSAVKQGAGVNRTVRQHIVEEQGGYCLDAARVEEQLRSVASRRVLWRGVAMPRLTRWSTTHWWSARFQIWSFELFRI